MVLGRTYLSVLGLLKLDLLEGQGSALGLEDGSFILRGKFRHCEVCRGGIGSKGFVWKKGGF